MSKTARNYVNLTSTFNYSNGRFRGCSDERCKKRDRSRITYKVGKKETRLLPKNVRGVNQLCQLVVRFVLVRRRRAGRETGARWVTRARWEGGRVVTGEDTWECVCGEGRKSATPLWVSGMDGCGPSWCGVTFLQHLSDTSATPVALEQLSNPRHHNVWTVRRPLPPRHAPPPPLLISLQAFTRFCWVPLCFL